MSFLRLDKSRLGNECENCPNKETCSLSKNEDLLRMVLEGRGAFVSLGAPDGNAVEIFPPILSGIGEGDLMDLLKSMPEGMMPIIPSAEMNALHNIDRVKRYITADVEEGATKILAAPNFPTRPGSKIMHGPDMLQTVADIINDKLESGVKVIKNVSFRRPVRRNNLVMITSSKDEIATDECCCTGELVTDEDETLYFAILKSRGENKAEPVSEPPLDIPCIMTPSFQGRLDGNRYSREVVLPSDHKTKVAIITETIISVGNSLFDEIGLSDHPLRLFSKLDNIDFGAIQSGGVFEITMELRKQIVRNDKVFCGVDFEISDLEGTMLTKGSGMGTLVKDWKDICRPSK